MLLSVWFALLFAALVSVWSPFPAEAQLVAAVLPTSRSVQVGTPATAFATIINNGTVAATGCSIAPATSVPATFTYQTTNPTTNQVTGTPNTPGNIQAGASQSFVFAFTPTIAFAPIEVALTFACSNTAAAPSISGINTLLLTASTTRPPDVVALAATTSNNGIVNIPEPTGTGVFSVATVNVGVSAGITASVDTGSATLPITLTLCQTNPTTGACISNTSPSVTTTINAGATPTFGFFVQGAATVPFNPATNRIFVRFNDAAGVTRGSTSVAVQTATAPGPPTNQLADILVGVWLEEEFNPPGFLSERIDALYTFRLDPNAVPPQFIGTGGRLTFVSRPGGPVVTSQGDFFWDLSGNALTLVFSSGRTEATQIAVVDTNNLSINPSSGGLNLGPGRWQRLLP